MKKTNLNGNKAIRLLAVAMFMMLPLQQPAAQQNILLETEARRLLEHFINRETEHVREMLAEEVNAMIPEGQLEEIANGLEVQLGSFEYVDRALFDKADEYEVVVLVCQFEKMEIGFRVVFNRGNMVAGFQFVPAPATSFSPPPVYADSSLFAEYEIAIDCDGITLPGIVTMPHEQQNVPVVVLVHGSGPHDADETIGPNKPFRDMAWGLASRGIAVLRYEKRTLKHGGTFDRNNFTIWDETGNDALAAVAAAREIPGADPGRIHLLGHSLGGMLAPAIASKDPGIAGIIIMAGNSRPLQYLVPEQYEYLMSLQGKLTDQQKDALEEIREQARAISENRLEGLTYRETLLNLPPAYWADLNSYDQRAVASGLPQRILVLQGERDYQVTMEDFAGWQKALKGHPGARLISYPTLNHLMMEGEGAPNPAEYYELKNVYQGVIDDIASWIGGG
ncbi:MAG: alpha/beta fold hydrolase [Marinilabiliales bacterium]|nr:MAG: alpha/beta fold hydrolase [Marinilabiliales bacterium]